MLVYPHPLPAGGVAAVRASNPTQAGRVEVMGHVAFH
jgi:hypothetical protein